MPYVAFPMRLENGFLRRVDQPAALLALIEVMARTPHGSWPGSAHFGLRDYLQASLGRSVDAKTAIQEINAAFVDLGIHYRVESLIREQPGEVGSSVFAISLISEGGHSQTIRVTSQD